MAEDLAALERQRAELDQRIGLARQAARDAWNDRLQEISDAVYRLGERRSRDVEQISRKNVRTLKLGGVAVRLGFIETGYGPSLAVEGSMTRCSFATEWTVPSVAVVTALVTALLDEGE